MNPGAVIASSASSSRSLNASSQTVRMPATASVRRDVPALVDGLGEPGPRALDLRGLGARCAVKTVRDLEPRLWVQLSPRCCKVSHRRAHGGRVSSYILDRSWEPERRRLTLQQESLDPLTIDHLERIGVS